MRGKPLIAGLYLVQCPSIGKTQQKRRQVVSACRRILMGLAIDSVQPGHARPLLPAKNQGTYLGLIACIPPDIYSLQQVQTSCRCQPGEGVGSMNRQQHIAQAAGFQQS